MRPRSEHPRFRRRGVSMVEALISLMITTALLTATGGAFVAAARSVQVNADVASATRSGRAALNVVLTEVRRADAVSCTTTYVDVIRPAAAREANEVYRRFAFDAAGKRLTAQVVYVAGPGTAYTLAKNVSAASFGPAVTGQNAAGQSAVQQLPVRLTVGAGAQALSFSGASGPRRSLAE